MSHYDDADEKLSAAELVALHQIPPRPLSPVIGEFAVTVTVTILELRRDVARLRALNTQLCDDVHDIARAVDIIAKLVSVADRAGIEAVSAELRDAVTRARHRPPDVARCIPLRNEHPDAVDLDIAGRRLVPGS